MSRERMCGVARVKEGFVFLLNGVNSIPVCFCRILIPAESNTGRKGADFTLGEREFFLFNLHAKPLNLVHLSFILYEESNFFCIIFEGGIRHGINPCSLWKTEYDEFAF